MKRLIKASSYNDRFKYLQALAEDLDYMSDDEIASYAISTDYGEPEMWIEIPDYKRDIVEKAVDEFGSDESCWYQIEYHPDDDTIYFGVSIDYNFETLRDVSEDTINRFKHVFKQTLGLN